MSKVNQIDKQFVFNSDNITEIIEKQSQGFALPRYMNPWFKNQIGVRKAGAVYGFSQYEIDEFTKCAIDIHYFANNYCKIKSEDGQIRQMKLRDYQYTVLDTYTKNRFTLNMSSRQTGKCVHLISNMLCKVKGEEMSIPAFKLLFKYKKNKTIYDYLKYPIYCCLEKFKIKPLFNIIEKIEKYQYRNINLDQDDIFKKINNITFVDKKDLYVNSPEGWVQVTEINETQPYKIYYIKTELGKELYCADNHILFDTLGQEILVKELNVGQHIITKDGFEKIVEISDYNSSNGMIDLTVNSDEMRYYTNDILSHNTITAAITLLHYCIFNTNKGCMVVANKSDTVVEILDKIKNIYKLLPFFLKPGLINWNSKSIVFENGCRIKSQARSKEPAIGFTIDFLYMDEFAHIPRNIIEHYYKAAIPTVSSIKGSKIVITSTPNGANLFKDLVLGASLPEGHQDKNMYKLIKVLWWQVPDGKFDDGTTGTRMDCKIYPMEFEMKTEGYTINKLAAELRELGYKVAIDVESTDNGDKEYIRILHVQDDETTHLEFIKKLKLNNDNFIGKFAMLTNWKEQETKLIGGEENFNQEYNIQFIAGSKRVLSANKAKILNERSIKYVNNELEILNKRLRFSTEHLRFAPDYIEHERNNYYWVSMIDVSEGLGQDDSVINGFRLMVRSKEWLEENKIKAMYDAFYLKQTFIYNYNRLDHKKELPELFYLLHFDYLNPEKTKCIFEYNGPGQAFLAGLPGVFDSNNNYGNFIFTRYKHNLNDKMKKPGIKVSRNKKELVKSYIDCIENDLLYVDEEETLNQIDNFIKVETRGGDYTYKADAGHDDIVMTLVDGSTFFETMDYKTMCTEYYKELPKDIQNLIDKALDLDYNPDAISYKGLSNALSQNKRSMHRHGRYSGGLPGRFNKK